MEIDIQKFNLINVIDSCSVWNLISSPLFFKMALIQKCFFCMTQFVRYECLFKLKHANESQDTLMKVLKKNIENKKVEVHHLTIDDLQEVAILQQRKRLGIGELSSIAFAKRTSQSFLTDDQNARKLAKIILGNDRVQTIPQLLGWLFVNQCLSQIDLYEVIRDHESHERPLKKYFIEVYDECQRINLLLKANF